MPAGPDTIVLIHGFWVTPRSWEDWKARYEEKGYKVEPACSYVEAYMRRHPETQKLLAR